MNCQMFKLVLEKAEEPEIKLLTFTGSLKKQESSRKRVQNNDSEDDPGSWGGKREKMQITFTKY